MARYNTITIDGIYLTEGAVSNGEVCKTTVTGLDKLMIPKKRVNVQASDGEVYSQVTPANNKGIIIEILISWLPQSMYEDINDVINAKSTSGIIALVFTGSTGNHSLSVIPAQVPMEFTGEFSGDIIREVKYRFQTV